MTGDCGAMQEESCVQDAQTRNTYKCLVAGSYYIQSNPVRMPMYGALMGGLILNILKPGKHQQKQHKG